MISRLTTAATLFAVIATASLSFAASSQGRPPATPAARTPMPVVQLEPVVIIVTRRAQLPR